MTLSASSRLQRIAVIGGGISGLAAAYRLRELDASLDVTLFEGSARLGGVLRTERRDGFLIEHSADMFTTREPWALALCRRIGFADELIETNAACRKAFILRRGRLLPVPDGFTLMAPARVWPVLRTGLLSWRGKLRLAAEYFVSAPANNDDESLAAFATRRFGQEAYERIIQPLIGGIYTADPTQLSLAATMPQFLEMERRFGSVIRGVRRTADQQTGERAASGARYSLFVAPRNGMSSLVDAIAARLPPGCVRLNTAVQRVRRRDSQWEVTVERQTSRAGQGTGGDRSNLLPASRDCLGETFDAVIIATPAYRAAGLLDEENAELARLLARVSHAGAAVVVCGYRQEQIARPLRGFGFVVPRIEGRKILAGSFSSLKFAGRAPDGHVLLRVFVGGACQPELLKLTDDEIKALVQQELVDLLGVTGAPLFADVVRWHGTMPQYHVGHLQLVEQIEAHTVALPNFALAGNAYRGVGIPFCIRSGELAADRIADAAR